MKRFYTVFLVAILVCAQGFISGCDTDSSVAPTPTGKTAFAVAIRTSGEEAADVVVGIDDLMSGEISPVGRGFEQGGWRYFYDVNNTIISTGYGAHKTCVGYHMHDGALVEKGKFAYSLSLDNFGKGDDHTLVAVAVPRKGFENRILYLVDTDKMLITKEVETKIDERTNDSLTAWPTGLVVRDGKLFVSYYHVHTRGDFSTPNANQARIAVYNYPSLTFDKYITDDRTSNIGIYGNFTGVVKTENGDIYSYSSSSLASGFRPVPSNPSGILRIKNGTTEFDKTYFLNFEQASGGRKINFMHYAGNGKAVVRMVVNDSELWATFKPTTATPMCKLAIVDLNTQAVTEVQGVPLHGGQWATPALNHNGKVYMNISDVNGAYIYEIDAQNATGKKGARVLGSEIKGIYALQ